jgi:hypothetical protein
VITLPVRAPGELSSRGIRTTYIDAKTDCAGSSFSVEFLLAGTAPSFIETPGFHRKMYLHRVTASR